MRNTAERWLADECDIVRQVESGTGGIAGKEPTHDDEIVAAGVSCALRDEGSEFVRLDSGERVQRPATVRLPRGTDVQEGDRIVIDGEATDYEVRGLTRHRDTRRDVVTGLEAEVERV